MQKACFLKTSLFFFCLAALMAVPTQGAENSEEQNTGMMQQYRVPTPEGFDDQATIVPKLEDQRAAIITSDPSQPKSVVEKAEADQAARDAGLVTVVSSDEKADNKSTGVPEGPTQNAPASP